MSQLTSEIKIFPSVIGQAYGESKSNLAHRIAIGELPPESFFWLQRLDVYEGKVVNWSNPHTVNLALTAIDDGDNSRKFSNEQVNDFLHALLRAFNSEDPHQIRAVIQKYPTMVAQPQELFELPDELLFTAAYIEIFDFDSFLDSEYINSRYPVSPSKSRRNANCE